MSGTAYWVSQPYGFLSSTNAATNTLSLKVTNSADYAKYYNFTATSVPAANRAIALYDPLADCNLQLGIKRTLSITSATTLTTAQSGSICSITSASGAFAITLPATASSAGCHYDFVIQDRSGSGDVTVVASTAAFRGSLVQNGTATDASGTTLTITVANAVNGDHFSIKSNGTYWTLYAWATTAATYGVA